MEPVTIEQCQELVRSASLKRADHHRCGGCGYMTRYVFRPAAEIYFDPRLEGLGPDDVVVGFDAGCDCSSSGPAPVHIRSWGDFAGVFNMQTPETRARMWDAVMSGHPTHDKKE